MSNNHRIEGDWVLVPRVPTIEMIDAGDDRRFGNGPDIVGHIWQMMIAAAPKPSTDVQGVLERLREFGNITYESGIFTDKTVCDEAATLLSALEQENARLRQERDSAVAELEEGLEPRIKKLTFEDGAFDLQMTGDAVNMMAMAFVSQFKAMGAENYFEMNLYDRAEPFQRYTVTVQKVGAKSPADKVRDAEAQLSTLQDEVRVKALEEAAQVATDRVWGPTDLREASDFDYGRSEEAKDIAAAIRALAQKKGQ